MTKFWYQELFHRCISLCFRKKTLAVNRTIHIGHILAAKLETEFEIPEKYPNNKVVSSRYTAVNFLPKNIFEQFHRIANFYFLVVAIIAVIIDSPVSPWTSIIPLIFVVSVTAVKQGYEDWLRHKADKEINHRETYTVINGEEREIQAMDINVGEIVKIRNNEAIPCDMVMLSSDNSEGECSITTANLDGETNLKTFCCVTDTRQYQSDGSFFNFKATIECQQPITDLYRFIGRIHVYNSHGDVVTKPLGAENVLLRGSRLKNTHYVYGCAVYTGQDTKISLNSRFKSVKFSRVEKRMNAFLIVFLVILVIYSGVWTGLKYWWYSNSNTFHSEKAMWYVRPFEPSATFGNVISDFLSFMVLCNYVIPISMYVTVELMKFGGKLFFQWDAEMYDPLINEPAKANTSDINEELGQVEFLFSDKTGTLTENEMTFRQCSVNGIKYEEVNGMLSFKSDLPVIFPAQLPTITPEIEQLFTVLVLCHTVRVDNLNKITADDYATTGVEYEYQSSSPDEKALIEASARFGIVFHGVKENKLIVSYFGCVREYVLHHILEFDSTRKRMSCIVAMEDGNIYLLVKGADSAMLGRCQEGDVTAVEKHIEDFSNIGLRTLCIAQRKLSKEEFEVFDLKLKAAKSSLESREEKLSCVYDEIECNFNLLGATAVEDKLQDGVPETIKCLREAGIQVWVLTGDKVETAVNISYSAGHFSKDMKKIYFINQKSKDDAGQALKGCITLLCTRKEMYNEKYALIIDGQSLAYAMDRFTDDIRSLCLRVNTVLCCRMTPLQKAQVVRLIKNSELKPTIAAIGDGANDVSMIQEAHVGLGIMGKEGRQAVRSSDYAFGRFKFLRRCLLVHGHYFYWRIATLVQYFFYKNVAMITAQMYFTFFSGFSTISLLETIFLTLYNTTFTSLPILVFGLLEKPIKENLLLRKGYIYRQIRNNARLTSTEFLKWTMLGLWHSLVFFFGVYFGFAPSNAPARDGHMYGIYEFGAIIITVCVVAVNVKLMLETYLWNGIVVFGFMLTFAGYPAVLFLYSEVFAELFGGVTTLLGVFQKLWSCGYVWLLMIVLLVISLIPDILLRYITDTFSDASRKNANPKKRALATGIVSDNDNFSDKKQIFENTSTSKQISSSLTIGHADQGYSNLGFELNDNYISSNNLESCVQNRAFSDIKNENMKLQSTYL